MIWRSTKGSKLLKSHNSLKHFVKHVARALETISRMIRSSKFQLVQFYGVSRVTFVGAVRPESIPSGLRTKTPKSNTLHSKSKMAQLTTFWDSASNQQIVLATISITVFLTSASWRTPFSARIDTGINENAYRHFIEHLACAQFLDTRVVKTLIRQVHERHTTSKSTAVSSVHLEHARVDLRAKLAC